MNKEKPNLKAIEAKILEVIKNESNNQDGGIEIYTDYRDRGLETSTIKKLLNSNNPRESLEEMLFERATDYAIEYGEGELEKEIKKHLSEEEKEIFSEKEEYFREFIQENCYFYYDINDFNQEVKVNILIDCGNGNSDYSLENILNWYGTTAYQCEGEIDELSSILWLANTQGKGEKLEKACKARYNGNFYDSDAFIKSCIEELENMTSSSGTITFLVEMPLLDAFDLKNRSRVLQEGDYKYYPQNNPDTSYVQLDKSVMCGLFDSWSGGGSLLEINLEKDVEVPLKYAKIGIEGCKTFGYDINEVYGLSGDCWRKTAKMYSYC